MKREFFYKKCIKFFNIILLYMFLFIFFFNYSAAKIYATEEYSDFQKEKTKLTSGLFAKYACLIDADTGRVLVGKNENVKAPNASTTKIMTCIIALENCPLDLKCTASSYAASMPDVQLNLVRGETFTLKDLLYSLMLRSHNDTAVVIAENVAFYLNNKDKAFVDTSSIKENATDTSRQLVNSFAQLMNSKATELNCTDTYFITPNGLDATDDTGTHSTTAYELAKIMAYCINNQEFLKITQTSDYTFSSDRQSYRVSNTNAFLNMYPNIISGKTGFTGNAGYCYVCAYKDDDRTFIVALLACGWPGNKTYKWKDSKKMLDFARENYFKRTIISTDYPIKDIKVNNGLKEITTLFADIPKDEEILVSDKEKVNILYNLPPSINAPVTKGQNVGLINIYIDNSLYKSFYIKGNEEICRKNYWYYLKFTIKSFLFCRQ